MDGGINRGQKREKKGTRRRKRENRYTTGFGRVKGWKENGMEEKMNELKNE